MDASTDMVPDDPTQAHTFYREWLCDRTSDDEIIIIDRARLEAKKMIPDLRYPGYLSRPFQYPQLPEIYNGERQFFLRTLERLGMRAPGELGQYFMGLRLLLTLEWEWEWELEGYTKSLTDEELITWLWFVERAWPPKMDSEDNQDE